MQIQPPLSHSSSGEISIMPASGEEADVEDIECQSQAQQPLHFHRQSYIWVLAQFSNINIWILTQLYNITWKLTEQPYTRNYFWRHLDNIQSDICILEVDIYKISHWCLGVFWVSKHKGVIPCPYHIWGWEFSICPEYIGKSALAGIKQTIACCPRHPKN